MSLIARDHLWLNIKGSAYVSDITLTELLSSSSLQGEKQDYVQSRREVQIGIAIGVFTEHLNYSRKAGWT